jgi:hypothetical protein
MSLIVMHAGMFALKETDSTVAERHAAALEVALELVG